MWVNPVQGPWYEATISKLSTNSSSGCVQMRVMDVVDRETAMVMVGAEGSRPGKQQNKCQQLEASVHAVENSPNAHFPYTAAPNCSGLIMYVHIPYIGMPKFQFSFSFIPKPTPYMFGYKTNISDFQKFFANGWYTKSVLHLSLIKVKFVY